MCPHINLLAIDDTKVSSDKDFVLSFLVLCAKSLICTYYEMECKHNCLNKKRLRAERSSLRVRHPHLTTKNRASNLIYIRKLTLCYLVQTSLLPAYVYIPLQRWGFFFDLQIVSEIFAKLLQLFQIADAVGAFVEEEVHYG